MPLFAILLWSFSSAQPRKHSNFLKVNPAPTETQITLRLRRKASAQFAALMAANELHYGWDFLEISMSLRRAPKSQTHCPLPVAKAAKGLGR